MAQTLSSASPVFISLGEGDRSCPCFTVLTPWFMLYGSCYWRPISPCQYFKSFLYPEKLVLEKGRPWLTEGFSLLFLPSASPEFWDHIPTYLAVHPCLKISFIMTASWILFSTTQTYMNVFLSISPCTTTFWSFLSSVLILSLLIYFPSFAGWFSPYCFRHLEKRSHEYVTSSLHN